MRISDWSSDVCSSDLGRRSARPTYGLGRFAHTAFVGVSRWSRNWHRGGRLRRGDDGVSAWPLSDPLQTARLSLTHLRCAHALLAFHHRYRCRVAWQPYVEPPRYPWLHRPSDRKSTRLNSS